MKVQFLKWGNSLALRVPKVIAQEIEASVGKPHMIAIANAPRLRVHQNGFIDRGR